MQAENICFFCTACQSKSNMAQNKSRNTQITYLNIAGQRWNHNAQKQDRYRRDWTHLPGSPCAPTVNNLYPECYTCTGDVRHSRKARQVLETTRECVQEAPHDFCSACFVTRARLEVLQPDSLSLSSRNVGLWVRGVAALLLAPPLSPTLPRCRAEMCVPAQICHAPRGNAHRRSFVVVWATQYGIAGVPKLKKIIIGGLKWNKRVI